jgi:hypothetical protein
VKDFESFIFPKRNTPNSLGQAAFKRSALGRPPVHTRGGKNNRARTRLTPINRGGLQSSKEAPVPKAAQRSSSKDIVRQVVAIQQLESHIKELLHEWTGSGNTQHKESALAHMQTILDLGVFEFLFTTSEYPIELYLIENNTAHETYLTSGSGTTLEITNIFRDSSLQDDINKPPRVLVGTPKFALRFEDFAHALRYDAQLAIRPVSLG